MNEEKSHPAVVAYHDLLALRQHAASNPNDVAARFAIFCAANLVHSHAQLFQDLFAAFCLKGKRNGFFVEFGATNGVDLSNTFLLERHFQWKGVLAEPVKCFHSALRRNRQAAVDTHCVWSETGKKIEFRETEVRELSTISSLAERADFNSEGRRKGITYFVDSISLNDLLQSHKCPKEIDYLSIDTEGSELDILRHFDFDKYDINIMTVEHNFCEPERNQLYELLTSKGFLRLFESFSKFDDWISGDQSLSADIGSRPMRDRRATPIFMDLDRLPSSFVSPMRSGRARVRLFRPSSNQLQLESSGW
jgi:FkbM family methyltransferase